jgi:hypothetical protein
MERFGVAALRPRALTALPPVFDRRLIALPIAQASIVAGLTGAPEVAFAAQ